MSRIGKMPVAVRDGVQVAIEGQTVTAKGPKGELSVELIGDVTVSMTDEGVSVQPVGLSKRARSMWGMSRTLVDNIVIGVSDGFEKRLEINGVGYRAILQGRSLHLALGFSHDIDFQFPRVSRSSVPSQPRSSFRVSTSRRSARLPLKSAVTARRSPTRARA